MKIDLRSQRSVEPFQHKLLQSISVTSCLSHTQVSMTSGTRELGERSISCGISSTNLLSPLLRTRGSEGFFSTLWRSLTSSTSSSCNRLRISTNSKFLRRVLNHSVDPHVKISCHQVHPRRFVRSQRSHSPSTVHAPSCCHHADVLEHQPGRKFNQAYDLLRYHVRVRSGFLVSRGGIGPSTAFPSWWAPVYCGCLLGPTGVILSPG